MATSILKKIRKQGTNLNPVKKQVSYKGNIPRDAKSTKSSARTGNLTSLTCDLTSSLTSMLVSENHSDIEEEKHKVRYYKRMRYIQIEDVSSSSSESGGNTSSDEEDEVRQIDLVLYKYRNELPREYWTMPKIVRLIRVGNEAATLTALAYFLDLLSDEKYTDPYQYAFMRCNGLEILVNILETDDFPCISAALQVLDMLSKKSIMKRELIHLGILPVLIKRFAYPSVDHQILITKVLLNLAKIRKAKKIIRINNGIAISLGIPKVCGQCLQTKMKYLDLESQQRLKLLIVSMHFWWTLASSRKCREEMLKNGFVYVLSTFLKSIHWEAVIATMGCISLCCEDKKYQEALVTQKDFVKTMFDQLLAVNHIDVKRFTSRAVACTAKNQTISRMIREYGGLPVMVALMTHSSVLHDDISMAAVTSAIYTLANNNENRRELVDLKTTQFMLELLQRHKNEDVLACAAGILSEMLKVEKTMPICQDRDGVRLVLEILGQTVYEPLIINIVLCVQECAKFPQLIPEIEKYDGIRSIWSLIRHKSQKIKIAAAWCLAPLIRNTPRSGEIVKHLVGGLEAAIELLKSEDNEILAAACFLLSEIAKDKENLNVLSHFELIPLMAKHFGTMDENVQENIAHLIASSCLCERNTKKLTKLGAISLLIVYLQHPKLSVQKSAVMALARMSRNRFNCITIKETGIDIVLHKYLRTYDDQDMQNGAKECLQNIRNFCMEAEKFYFRHLDYKLDMEIDSEPLSS